MEAPVEQTVYIGDELRALRLASFAFDEWTVEHLMTKTRILWYTDFVMRFIYLCNLWNQI